ncbi:basic proline-rich protein-like [Heterocephalus glaber]|uniref:Basic proline-rich protein-like n=1 Tax=Heterocephalus glaber TaxID=10181 RepID=A0AAX6QQX2_HETGA|nr:basic proline-rich protein-like [Heterocephalus glaber]
MWGNKPGRPASSSSSADARGRHFPGSRAQDPGGKQRRPLPPPTPRSPSPASSGAPPATPVPAPGPPRPGLCAPPPPPASPPPQAGARALGAAGRAVGIPAPTSVTVASPHLAGHTHHQDSPRREVRVANAPREERRSERAPPAAFSTPPSAKGCAPRPGLEQGPAPPAAPPLPPASSGRGPPGVQREPRRVAALVLSPSAGRRQAIPKGSCCLEESYC